jgi:signal peptidase I
VQHGDIIVFTYPEDIRVTYVKRVIGVPGDRIHMENGQVIRNGHRLVEPYTQHVATYADPYRDNFPRAQAELRFPRGRDMLEHHVVDGELVVPPGMLFALGDNRDNSADSRVPVREGGVGMLPVANLAGRVDGIVGSWDLAIKSQPIWTWGKGLRLSRFFSSVR